MKNESLFPLERNNYFFGKLMTEREFDTEQMYFNNKRRLLSLALLSPGVVCGMTVTKVDGATIAVESGLALDGLGRELAIPELIVTLLSELEGFSGDRGHLGHVYLCAEYAEEQVEPMRALGGGTGGEQHGRVREAVRLYLRYGEPEPFEIDEIAAEDSRAESLEDKLERRARIMLYLARIHLIRWEEAYEIDRIEQVPFNQYALVSAMPETSAISQPEDEQSGAQAANSDCEKAPPAIAYGTAEVRILAGAKPGSVYYSDDIPHGLGLVPAAVTLGISNVDGAVFGDADVFGEDPGYTCAARVSTGDGTFKIGVRVRDKLGEQTIRFVWSAVSDPARAGTDMVAIPRITVFPSTARIRSFEMLRLTAERHGLPDGEIIWSVREPDGGEITPDGVYIAPCDPGVYIVVARCGDVSGTSIIVVH